MSRLIPHPILSLGLLAMWLLMNQPSLGHLILGSVIALGAGRALALTETDRIRLRNPAAMIRLVAYVTVDIIRSNIAVASLIVTRGRHGARRSAFIEVPLRIRDPLPLAVLSMILTATPGSAWLEHDSDSGILLMHVFDMVDEAEWQSIIRDRYETLLMEIFA